jgi:hypothetical protein
LQKLQLEDFQNISFGTHSGAGHTKSLFFVLEISCQDLRLFGYSNQHSWLLELKSDCCLIIIDLKQVVHTFQALVFKIACAYSEFCEIIPRASRLSFHSLSRSAERSIQARWMALMSPRSSEVASCELRVHLNGWRKRRLGESERDSEPWQPSDVDLEPDSFANSRTDRFACDLQGSPSPPHRASRSISGRIGHHSKMAAERRSNSNPCR